MTLDRLRPYQLETVEAAKNVTRFLCADDMGLGKTVEAIGIDHIRRGQNTKLTKTLVVSPLTGVVDSWARHFKEFTDLSVHKITTDGKQLTKKRRDENWQAFVDDPKPAVFCMHWQAVNIMLDELQSVMWLHIIADEAHRLKNRNTKWTKNLKKVRKVKYKTALTGTPLVNQPDELWSILNWLFRTKAERTKYFDNPESRLLNSYWAFYEKFVTYYEDEYGYKHVKGPKNVDYLAAILGDFYIRREKGVALPGLPPKQYTEVEVELLPGQRRMYNEMKDQLIAWTDKDEPIVAPVVIAKLMRLQQMALATATIEEDGMINLSSPSSKIDALKNILEDTDSKVVVFSQFSKMIDLIESELDVPTYKLTGKTPQHHRSEMIADFLHNGNSPRVFLATIGAGGTGIDLYSAKTAIFMDRSWSPADNLQAEDRLHRSGQEDQVQIIDVVAKKTVDKYKARKLEAKKSWIKEVLDAAG